MAGREDDLEIVNQIFTALSENVLTQSIIFSGLRGVGKTVLLNKLQVSAETK